ncbi:hypothetical protein L9F63_002630, partial [Diploptera punctata]
AHAWSEKHRIETKAKLLKQLEKLKGKKFDLEVHPSMLTHRAELQKCSALPLITNSQTSLELKMIVILSLKEGLSARNKSTGTGCSSTSSTSSEVNSLQQKSRLNSGWGVYLNVSDWRVNFGFQ